MSNLGPLFMSSSREWETPEWLFNVLNDEFSITLDLAASKINAKCKKYYDEAMDAFKQPWTGVCWLNPPYGREVTQWVEKAYKEAVELHNCVVVMLLPARTDTRWFHSYIWDSLACAPKKGVQIRFIPSRLKFVGANSAAPFPSMVIVFGGTM